MFWKKGGALLLVLMLLLTACSGEAALVRDSIATTLDKSNYDFQGTLKVTGDLETWLTSQGKLDEPTKALIRALSAGITVKGSMLDHNRSRQVVELNDDQMLRDHGLWTGGQKASAEFLLDMGKIYVTTPIDQKYLLIDMTAQDESLDPQKLQEFQKKLNDLTFSFMRNYFSTYGFKLSQVQNLGKTTVELPDGQKATATRIAIQMDLAELIRMLLYTAKDATENKKVRDFAVDVTMLIQSFAREVDPELANEEPASREQVEQTVDMVLQELKAQLELLEKTYTVEQMVEKVREAGLSDLSLKMEYYIDANKMPLRSVADLSVTLDDPDGESEKVTIGIQSDSLAWNFGKATAFAYPAADKVVTTEQLKQDEEAIQAFHENGFLRALIREMNKEFAVIVLDLNENSVMQNGELVEGVKPYSHNGTTMVPLRFIAESMGAAVTYDANTRTAILEKDGNRLEVTTGSSAVRVNGETRTMPAAATVKDGTLYVPLRFVSSELGADVTWIPEIKQAIIEFKK